MATNVVMPKMGESITEGTVLRWLKKEGDKVEKDEPILEISTDKVDTEVPSPVAGTLLRILAQEKQTVSVGEPIASIGTNGEASSAVSLATTKQAAPSTESVKPASEAPAAPAVQSPTQTASQTPSPNGQAGGQPVVMPKMGESIAEGTVLRWLKNEGDKVEKDEPILEISTDKVDTEVPAPFAGTLSKIVAKEKETVAVGATIAYLSGGAAPAQPTASAGASESKVVSQVASQPVQPQVSQLSQTPKPAMQGSSATKDDRFYSPLVKNIAKTEGISPEELSRIPGTGMSGRVNKNDMLKYVDARKSGAVPRYQTTPSFAPTSPSFAPGQPK